MAEKKLKRQLADLEVADPSFSDDLNPPKQKKAKTAETPATTPVTATTRASSAIKDRPPTPFPAAPAAGRRQRMLARAEPTSLSYSADDEASDKSSPSILNNYETPRTTMAYRGNVRGMHRPVVNFDETPRSDFEGSEAPPTTPQEPATLKQFVGKFEVTPGAEYQGYETPPPRPEITEEELATGKPRVPTPYPVCAYPSQYHLTSPAKKQPLETFSEEEVSPAPADPDDNQVTKEVPAAVAASKDVAMVSSKECISKLKAGVDDMINKMIENYAARCEHLRVQLINDLDGYLIMDEAAAGDAATKVYKKR